MPIVGVIVIFTGLFVIRDASLDLMDTMPDARMMTVVREAALKVPGVRGVDKAYAIQAGREVRIMVNNDEVDDEGAKNLAKSIAKKIEAELKYPGRIKVTIIRETRIVEYAR